MDDVLGYDGKHALVTGAASGMGEATARLLVELGARVTALDVKTVEVEGVESRAVDLRETGVHRRGHRRDRSGRRAVQRRRAARARRSPTWTP